MPELKQLTPTCLCGQPIELPKHKNVSHCRTEGCGVKWKQDKFGFWAIGLTRIILTPRFTKEKVRRVSSKPEGFRKYLKAEVRRKAGRRC